MFKNSFVLFLSFFLLIGSMSLSDVVHAKSPKKITYSKLKKKSEIRAKKHSKKVSKKSILNSKKKMALKKNKSSKKISKVKHKSPRRALASMNKKKINRAKVKRNRRI